jgi:hypothetical protein
MTREKLETPQAHVHACAVCSRAKRRANDFCEAGSLFFFERTEPQGQNRVTEA